MLFWSGSAHAATFYVSPEGKDINPGTAALPLATIAKAVEVARTTPGSNTISLVPGKYFNAASIVLDDRDSGLTITGAKPGAVAHVYGGVPVTGWQKWKGEIWRAPVPKDQRFYNLIVNESSAIMARTPNAGSGDNSPIKAKKGETVDKLVVPEEWKAYDFSDAQVHSFDGESWFSEVCAVLSPIDAEGELAVSKANRNGWGRTYMRGLLEFLDQPGEWCLKHKEGYVYYWPKSGNPADDLIVRPTAEKLFAIQGRSQETPAKNIVLSNLSIIGSDFRESWLLFKPNIDNSTPDDMQKGMIFGENVEKLTVKNSRLLAAGQSAVWLNKYAQNCVVESNLISGAGYLGVCMNGWTIGEGPFKSAAESYVNKNHRIENNFVYDCGKVIGVGSGIHAYQSGDLLIARNEVMEMPRYGISYKGSHRDAGKPIYGQKAGVFEFVHTRNIKLIGNRIHNVMRNTNDGGGIESWGVGRDNLWENNALHDIDWSIKWTGFGVVMYADPPSDYITQRNNMIYHCHSGYGHVLSVQGAGTIAENNFAADCTLARYAYATTDGRTKHVIRNNVFAFRPFKEYYTLRDNDGGITEYDRNVLIPPNPAEPNPQLNVKLKVDVNSYFGDPGVIRAKPAWDIQYMDYSLKADSPAYKLGYKDIPTDTIGLRKDFPFDTAAFTRRAALGTIQAEGYQRMDGLRTEGGVGIHMISAGAWAKYANIDFTGGGIAGVELIMAKGAQTIAPVRICLGAPTATPVAIVEPGKTRVRFNGSKANGVHNVFLVFPEGQSQCVIDAFRFVSTSEANAWKQDESDFALIDLKLSEASLKAPMKLENEEIFGSNPQPVSNKNDGGQALWSFDVIKPGKWALDILLLAPSASADSLFVDLGKQSFVMNNQITGDKWMWVRIGASDLTAGKHQVSIAQREPNVKVKALRLTRIGKP